MGLKFLSNEKLPSSKFFSDSREGKKSNQSNKDSRELQELEWHYLVDICHQNVYLASISQ